MVMFLGVLFLCLLAGIYGVGEISMFFQNEDTVLSSPRQVICGAAQEWIKSASNRTKGVNKVQIHVAWEPPRLGQFKLNVDGSRRSVTGCIGARGVIRDSFGDWVSGFAVNLGKGQVLEAEIWGLFFGLKLAIEEGINCLIIEMDSTTAINLCQNSSMLTVHPLATLVRSCCDLMQQVPSCALQHVFREKNGVADQLANWSYQVELWLCVFEHAPSWLSAYLVDDLLGIVHSRLVCLDQCV
ncbi:hypothetical protein CerSpe_080770 [Prunus speciosa]